MKRKKKMNIDWYLGFAARTSDRISELEDWDLPGLKDELEKIFEEWVNRSFFLPSHLRARTELALLFECTLLVRRYGDNCVDYDRIADKWTNLLLKDMEDLANTDRNLLAVEAARYMSGDIWNRHWTLIVSELVGPEDIGHILDMIRADMYYHHRHSDPMIFESFDLEYRRFATRLIIRSGSSRAGLRRKLTIDLHHQVIHRRSRRRRRSHTRSS